MIRSIRRRSAALVSAITLLGVSLTACAGPASEGLLASVESGRVIIGTKYDQPGLGLRAPDGTITGFDVDVAQFVVNDIADANGWARPSIIWRETPSAQRETLIQNGEVDMIAATYSINRARSESVNFGGPYLLTHQALLVREGDTEITGLDSLDGKILCSVTGSTPAQTVKDVLPGVQLQEYDTYSSCVTALRQGKIDALTTDAAILLGYSMQAPGQFRVVEMEREGEQFTDEYYGIGLANDDRPGTVAINDALTRLHESGEFDALLREHLGSGEAVSPGIPGDRSFLRE